MALRACGDDRPPGVAYCPGATTSVRIALTFVRRKLACESPWHQAPSGEKATRNIVSSARALLTWPNLSRTLLRVLLTDPLENVMA